MTDLTGTATKRFRRTKAQIEQVDRQIIAVLQEDHPQSVRHVFYRMTDPRLPEPVPKTDSGPGNGYGVVQRRLLTLRETGAIPYSWITDATRRGYFVNTYRSAGDFLRTVAGHYRADLWQQSHFYCEVWVESRSIAGVVQETCEELAVSLYPAGGFTSWTLAYQAAEYINQDARGRDCVILYIGDYDPAGVLIDKAIERELRKHLDPGIKLHFWRLGITEEQIERYDLPTKPRKANDKRSQHILETVEAEAMPANVLRHMLWECIENLLPDGALAVAKTAEASERAHIERMAEIMGGGAE